MVASPQSHMCALICFQQCARSLSQMLAGLLRQVYSETCLPRTVSQESSLVAKARAHRCTVHTGQTIKFTGFLQALNDCIVANPCVPEPQAHCHDSDILIPNYGLTCRCMPGFVGDGKVNGTGCLASVSLPAAMCRAPVCVALSCVIFHECKWHACTCNTDALISCI
jgi:hypothetical protein